ncbi:uncharacterized protein SCODWIG_03239 [Saccharomycodes ludwigii]|uniref:MICOS complex subunit MIC12 n=1 Tax=Saccharomycodes ludwigii TaxID=36035 RepID=A0A376B9W2_9ASCO|nr:hypothetical protein SCDLUD_003538 [Saccharomycodes ludwigii]KAH3900549.1 hypothetical protein SCDLUD_003538 [Saccharomycodes ludwigii]SSD61478.1 uncharacterized protein SCODWIG_03239 [Saccharomycodes ludwigii]
MSKIVKLVSITTIASAGLAYFYKDNGYYFNKSEYKSMSQSISNIIDRKTNELPTKSMGNTTMLPYNEEYQVRYPTETVKDIWNKSVRQGVHWLYTIF